MNGTYASPQEVEKYLKGIDYPRDKEDLLEAVKAAGANNIVIQTIERLEREEFNSFNDVSDAIEELE